MRIVEFMVCEYATIDASNRAILIGAGADGYKIRDSGELLLYLFGRIAHEPSSKTEKGTASITILDPSSQEPIPKITVSFTLDKLSPSTRFAHRIVSLQTEEKTLTFRLSLDAYEEEVKECRLRLYRSLTSEVQ